MQPSTSVGVVSVSGESQKNLSDISIKYPSKGKPTLDSDGIIRRSKRALEKSEQNYTGPKAVYWKASEPNQLLKLSGALNFIKKIPNYGPSIPWQEHFVYWPRYMVAGRINDIVSLFKSSAPEQFGSLTAEFVKGEAYDPLNPDHRNIFEQASSRSAKTVAKKYTYSLSEYIEFAEAYKAALKGKTETVAASSKEVSPRGTKAKGKEARLEQLINEFNTLMSQMIDLPKGQDLSTIKNVTNFNKNNYTKVTSDQPRKTSKTSFIRPRIEINGRYVSVPIQAKPENHANFSDYVREVVGRSRYKNFAEAIINNFNEQLLSKGLTVIENVPVRPSVTETQPSLGQLPSIQMPSVQMPLGQMPTTSSPRFSLPTTQMPGTSLPTASLPMIPSAQAPSTQASPSWLMSQMGTEKKAESSPPGIQLPLLQSLPSIGTQSPSPVMKTPQITSPGQMGMSASTGSVSLPPGITRFTPSESQRSLGQGVGLPTFQSGVSPGSQSPTFSSGEIKLPNISGLKPF